MARAEEIGTFDISTEAAPDCCTLFMPRRPETHAKLDAVHEAWELFDHEEMIERLLKQTEYIDFESNTYKAPKTLKRKHWVVARGFFYHHHVYFWELPYYAAAWSVFCYLGILRLSVHLLTCA